MRYDPEEGTFGSVCRVMSGFSDQFYKDFSLTVHRKDCASRARVQENTLRYLGRELHVGAKTETDAEDEGRPPFSDRDVTWAVR